MLCLGSPQIRAPEKSADLLSTFKTYESVAEEYCEEIISIFIVKHFTTTSLAPSLLSTAEGVGRLRLRRGGH